MNTPLRATHYTSIKDEIIDSQDTALDLTSQSSNSSSHSSQSSSSVSPLTISSQSSTASSGSGGGGGGGPIGRASASGSRKRSNTDSSKESDDYRTRRQRNNEAVKKSRQRSKAKTEETVERIAKLAKLNEDMERDVDILTKEIRLLSSMYVSHMHHAHAVTVDEDKLMSTDGKVYVELESSSSQWLPWFSSSKLKPQLCGHIIIYKSLAFDYETKLN